MCVSLSRAVEMFPSWRTIKRWRMWREPQAEALGPRADPEWVQDYMRAFVDVFRERKYLALETKYGYALPDEMLADRLRLNGAVCGSSTSLGNELAGIALRHAGALGRWQISALACDILAK